MANMEQTEIDALNERLDNMVKRGKAQRRQFNTMWQDGVNYVFDNQLTGKKRRKGWERVAINYIWPATIQEVALHAQQKDKIICLPGSKDPSDIGVAKTWTKAIQWQWTKGLSMPIKKIGAVMDNKVFGYSVTKTWWEAKHHWDEDRLDWNGKAMHRLIQPTYFGADPDAESVEDWSFCFTERRVRLGWAKQRWPDKARLMEMEANKMQHDAGSTASDKDDWYMNLADEDSGHPKNEGRIASILGIARRSHEEGESDKEDFKDDRQITIQEIYWRDYETRSTQLPDEDISEEELMAEGRVARNGDNQLINPTTAEVYSMEDWPKREGRRFAEPLYPHGRFVLRVGKTILNPDKVDQRWAYRRWPFIVTPNYMLPHIWQGMNAVEMSRQTQDWINVAASHMTNYIKFFGDPRVIMEKGALALDPGAKKPRLLSAAGGIWQVVKGAINKIRIEQPTAMPPGVMTFFSLMTQEMRNLTGMQEVTQGIYGKSGTTATESSRLNANSRLRVALQGVIQEESLRKTAEILAEIDQKMWSVEQWVRVIGENQQQDVAKITQGMKDARFDIDIEVGTAMPFDKERRRADYLQVAQLVANPAYMPILPEILTEFDIANKEEILSKVQGYQMFMQLQPYLPQLMQLLQQSGMAQQPGQQQPQPQPQPQQGGM